MEEEKKIVELTDEWAVVLLPVDAAFVKMDISVFQDGEIVRVYGELGPKEIRDAFRRAETGYIDDDDRFELTEKGKAMASYGG